MRQKIRIAAVTAMARRTSAMSPTKIHKQACDRQQDHWSATLTNFRVGPVLSADKAIDRSMPSSG